MFVSYPTFICNFDEDQHPVMSVSAGGACPSPCFLFVQLYQDVYTICDRGYGLILVKDIINERPVLVSCRIQLRVTPERNITTLG